MNVLVSKLFVDGRMPVSVMAALKLIAVVLFTGAFVGTLAGCVTTESKVFNSDTSPGRAVETHVNLAMKYYQQNDMESARRALDSALKIDKRVASVHNALGLVASRESDFKQAEKYFKKSISLDGNYSPARNNYAALLYNETRYKEALRQLEIVVDDELYENRMVALGNLGRVAVKLDDEKKAESTFKRMLNIDSRNQVALLELADLYAAQKSYKLATALYDKYRGVVQQQNSRGLFLGIKLAEAMTDADARASYVLALRNLYPESDEYRKYLAGDYE